MKIRSKLLMPACRADHEKDNVTPLLSFISSVNASFGDIGKAHFSSLPQDKHFCSNVLVSNDALQKHWSQNKK